MTGEPFPWFDDTEPAVRIATATGMSVDEARAALERLADDRYRAVVRARIDEQAH